MFKLIVIIDNYVKSIEDYSTFKEAHRVMEEAYWETIENGGSGKILEWLAWVDDGPNHYNYEWKIHQCW